MRIAKWVLTAAACLAATACGSNKTEKKLVAVSGTVTLNGKPLAGAMVQFLPDSPGGETASGRTGADGSYTLLSAPGPGTTPGTYRVAISRMVGADGKVVPEGTSPFTEGVKETLPPSYSQGDTKLVTSVQADRDSTTIDFPLRGPLVK